MLTTCLHKFFDVHFVVVCSAFVARMPNRLPSEHTSPNAAPCDRAFRQFPAACVCWIWRSCKRGEWRSHLIYRVRASAASGGRKAADFAPFRPPRSYEPFRPFARLRPSWGDRRGHTTRHRALAVLHSGRRTRPRKNLCPRCKKLLRAGAGSTMFSVLAGQHTPVRAKR
jgi:hypothetical protein